MLATAKGTGLQEDVPDPVVVRGSEFPLQAGPEKTVTIAWLMSASAPSANGVPEVIERKETMSARVGRDWKNCMVAIEEFPESEKSKFGGMLVGRKRL